MVVVNKSLSLVALQHIPCVQHTERCGVESFHTHQQNQHFNQTLRSADLACGTLAELEQAGGCVFC